MGDARDYRAGRAAARAAFRARFIARFSSSVLTGFLFASRFGLMPLLMWISPRKRMTARRRFRRSATLRFADNGRHASGRSHYTRAEDSGQCFRMYVRIGVAKRRNSALPHT